MTVKLCEKPSEKAENAAGLFTLGEVACAVGAQCGIPRRSVVVDRVVTDSRGDCSGALFVALKGGRFDGHDYVCEVFAKGACAALVSEIPPRAHPEWPLLVVDETLSALAGLAAYYRTQFSIPVIGITGSCGKTTVKEFLAAALSGRYRVAKAKASHNNIIGVSLTILSVRRDDEVLILELGTNAPGEIEALCEIGRPEIGVITNVGHAHLEKLRSVEGVKKEKGSLMRFLGEGGVLVTNIDCPECKELAGEFQGRAVTVAVEAQADHKVELTCEEERGLVFKYDGATATIPAPGRHNALNAGLAAAAAEILGVHSEDALWSVSSQAAF
jgi:UDP-N-acetylmuramoyl-tripeptide--D-alanyl-D-alanine ligase